MKSRKSGNDSFKKVLVDCRYGERVWNVGSLALHVVRKREH